VLSLMSASGYVWNAYQVGRLARAFLQRADRLRDQGDWSRAADSLQRYLTLHPEDLQARIRLAKTVDRGEGQGQSALKAIEFYRRALRAVPQEQTSGETALALRQRLGELLLDTAEWKLAEQQVQFVLQQAPQDPRSLRVLALARHEGFRVAGFSTPAEVQKALEAACKAQPDEIQLGSLLANFYRSQSSAGQQAQAVETADRVMDRIVEENSQSAKAHLARYAYRLRYQTLDVASPDLDEALRLDPSHRDVLLAAAERAVQLQQLEQAQHYYEEAIRAAPRIPSGYLGLAEVYLTWQERRQAVETLYQALRQTGEDAIAIRAGLAELLIVEQRLEEAQQCITALRQACDRRWTHLARIERLAVSNMLALLQGKFDVVRGEPRHAIPQLKQVILTQQTGPDARRDAAGRMHALLLVGRAYADLKEWDQAAVAFERAAQLNPGSDEPRLAAGDAWASSNQPESAIAAYRQAVKLQDQPETWLRLAHVLFLREQLKTSENRNWQEFQEALNHIKSAKKDSSLADPWRVLLLEAEFEVARVQRNGLEQVPLNRVRELLQEAENDYPDSVELARRLVIAYQRFGLPMDCDRVLRHLDASGDRSTATVLLHAQVCILRRDRDHARKTLAEALKSASPDEQPNIRRGLADLHLSEGHWQEAREQLLALVEANPSHTQALGSLTELALRRGKWDEAQHWENELRRVEGTEGTNWLVYAAQRLIGQSSGVNDPGLQEAEKLLSAIKSQRPAWSAAFALEGLLNERLGRPERAIEAYEAAIRLGEQQLSVFKRLLALLYRHQRLEAANTLLARLYRHVPQSQELSAAVISGAVGENRLDEALYWARKGVGERPDDPIAWSWLGALLLGADQVKEAETAFCKAVAVAPNDVRAWHGLFSFYVRTGQKSAAHEALQKLAGMGGWTEPQKARVLAQAHEFMGDRERAERYYQDAVTLDPNNAAMHAYLARFYMNSDAARAQASLRRVLELTPESGGTRRTLAVLLANQGGQDHWQEALQLIETSGKDDTESLLDRRLQIVLLVQRGEIEQAKQLLEKLAEQPSNAVERLWLARIYEQQGNVGAARKQLLALTAGGDFEAAHLAELVGFLLRHDVGTEAERWLEKLEQLAPNSWNAVVLRARWHHRRGASSEIQPLVDGFLQTNLAQIGDGLEKAKLYQRSGDFYQSVELYGAAEGSYREALRHDAQRYAPLAQCLVRQGRTQEAIQLCTVAAQSDDSSRPAIILANLLLPGAGDSVDVSQVESILSHARQKHVGDVNLLMAAANFQLTAQKKDEAIQSYRQVLRSQPGHVAALNNLAVLLSERADTWNESLNYIDQAIQHAGPQDNLLDTKALILLQQNRTAEAAELLERIAASVSADPRHLLHLAVARRQQGAADSARQVFERARDSDLRSQFLSPVDRQWLKELEDLEGGR
jgi:tetratricopeptide (TPR) repeat protein